MAKVDAGRAARSGGHKSFFRRMLERSRERREEPDGEQHSAQGPSDHPGETPPPRTLPPTVKSFTCLELAKLLLSSGTVIVAVSGASLYAIVAFGYQRFYGDLGVAPSDVGISQTDIVAQAAIALAYLGAVTIFLLLLLHLVLAVLPEHTKRWVSIIGRTLIVVLVTAAIVFIIPALRSRLGAVLTIAGVAFVSILAGFANRPPDGRAGWIRRTEALIFGLATLFLLGLFFTIARADDLGNRVSEGYTFAPGDRYTTILDVRADPVCVSTLPQTSKSKLMYYMGNSGDWDVFYDPEAQQTISRSRSELELAFIPYPSWRTGSFFVYYDSLKGFCQ
jgi:hypothetical protein